MDMKQKNILVISMKVFYQSKLARLLLWPGYNTITLGCFVFTKVSEGALTQRVLNHEAIHVRQWEELTIASAILLLGLMCFTGFSFATYLICPIWFYLQYFLEYLISRIYHLWKGLRGQSGNAISYGNSAFEMEAKANEDIDGYLDVRYLFEFVKYYGNI